MSQKVQVSEYQSQEYWRKRSDMLYYRYVDYIVRTLGSSATSMIDVGSGNCPYLDWFDWIPERVSVDIRVPYRSSGVEGIKGDILKLNFEKKFDLCTCFQVLEDPVDYDKLTAWTGRPANYRIVVSEPFQAQKGKRLICVYDADPGRKFTGSVTKQRIIR